MLTVVISISWLKLRLRGITATFVGAADTEVLPGNRGIAAFSISGQLSAACRSEYFSMHSLYCREKTPRKRAQRRRHGFETTHALVRHIVLVF